MDTSVIITGVIIFLIIFIGAILLSINLRNIEIVKENSERLRELSETNSKFNFNVLKPRLTFCHECNSKRQLDNFSLDDFFISLINSKPDFFSNIIEKLTYNITSYKTYVQRIKTISSTATEELAVSLGLKLKQFQKYEDYLFQKTILSAPQTDIDIIFEATYTSPQGRNHYYTQELYNYSDLKKFIKRAQEIRKKAESRSDQIRIERALMTDSLRYDILKRDGFRCKICGSEPSDGVKLHVDHIFPVSKGGKTVPNNLQTLCDRCNMGKSNKT